MKITAAHPDPMVSETSSRLIEGEASRSSRLLDRDPIDRATEPGSEEVDMLDLLIVLARRKRLIAAITLGSAVIAAIVALLIPNRYTATTKILPPQQSQSASTMIMNQLAGAG